MRSAVRRPTSLPSTTRALAFVILCAVLALAGCGGSGLSGKTVDEKATAAGQLGVQGANENVPVLLTAAEIEPEMVQVEAVNSLGRIGTADAVAALGKLAGGAESKVMRVAIAQALTEVLEENYPKAAPILVSMGKAALPLGPGKDPHVDVRRAVTTSLAIVRQKEGLDFMVERATKDPDEQIRNASVKTLGRLGDPRAVDALAEIVKTDDDKNKAWAVEALGLIKDPRGLPTIRAALSDYDHVTRGKAAWSLYEIAGKDAVPELKAALAREENEMPAVVLSHALARLGETDALGNLEHYILYARSSFARAEAGRALKEIGRCESMAAVDRAYREDRDGLVKREAAAAARRLLSICPKEQLDKILKTGKP